LDEAIRLYSEEGYTLSAAAKAAGVTIYDLSDEIARRDLRMIGSAELHQAGLQTLAKVFDDPELLEIVAEAEHHVHATEAMEGPRAVMAEPRLLTLSESEEAAVREISRQEKVSELALLQRWIRQGIQQYKLDRAIKAYRDGGLSLGEAAEYAGVTKQALLDEIERRGLALIGAEDLFERGVESAATVLDDPELLKMAVKAKRRDEVRHLVYRIAEREEGRKILKEALTAYETTGEDSQ